MSRWCKQASPVEAERAISLFFFCVKIATRMLVSALNRAYYGAQISRLVAGMRTPWMVGCILSLA